MSNITLSRAANMFLNTKLASTAASYKYPMIYMLEHFGGDTKVRSITPEALLGYYQALLASKNWAVATQRKHAKTLKVFWNWCVGMGFIRLSPARVIKARRPPRRMSREKAMTNPELDAILEELRYRYTPRDYALVLFLADTGCRRGGVVSLLIKDLDLTNRIAIVTEKGEKERMVAFSYRCAEAIQCWLTWLANHQIQSDYVFCTRAGRAMRAENVSLMMRRTAELAGLSRPLSPHSLRHRKGHQLADARISPSVAATVLGHSDPNITLGYYSPDDWESAERAQRELLGEEFVRHSARPPAPESQGNGSSGAASGKIISFRGDSA